MIFQEVMNGFQRVIGWADYMFLDGRIIKMPEGECQKHGRGL